MHYTASLSTTHDALHIAMVRPLSQRRQSFSDGAGRRPIQGSSSDVYYSEQWRRNEFEIFFFGGGAQFQRRILVSSPSTYWIYMYN